jgi:hypothetical protein
MAEGGDFIRFFDDQLLTVDMKLDLLSDAPVAA